MPGLRKGGEVGMTPLERARQRKKTCKTCESRTEINGVSYCEKDGKMLDPMLLECPGPCPIEQRRLNDGRRNL